MCSDEVDCTKRILVIWGEVAALVSTDFSDVGWEKMLIDAMTVRMTLHPETLDTIVDTKLHADILSDLAAALAGSIGIAPTSNLDPTEINQASSSLFAGVLLKSWARVLQI